MTKAIHVVSLEPVVNGGSLEIYNDAGKDVVSAGTLFNGHGNLKIYDKEGIPVSGMFADNTGGSISILKIINEKVKEVATLNGNEIVCRKLRVVNPEGKTIAILGESLTGSGGYLYINNINDKFIAGIGVSHRNSGVLSIPQQKRSSNCWLVSIRFRRWLTDPPQQKPGTNSLLE